jgi:myo-inositol-1-phosphate synthase
MTQYLYKSQNKEHKRKAKLISDVLKKKLDKAVVECIYKDHLTILKNQVCYSRFKLLLIYAFYKKKFIRNESILGSGDSRL